MCIIESNYIVKVFSRVPQLKVGLDRREFTALLYHGRIKALGKLLNSYLLGFYFWGK